MSSRILRPALRLSQTVRQPTKRLFSQSRYTATKVVANPRQSDEGQNMLVEMTARASTVCVLRVPQLTGKRLKEIMQRDNNPSLVLRISVESGGCHGFQYLMSLADSSKVDPDDTVFETEDGNGARFVMDEPSLELLQGSKIDFTMELIGSQFKIVDNPHATSSCGCGTSFDIKA